MRTQKAQFLGPSVPRESTAAWSRCMAKRITPLSRTAPCPMVYARLGMPFSRAVRESLLSQHSGPFLADRQLGLVIPCHHPFATWADKLDSHGLQRRLFLRTMQAIR